jgi:outer membrane protein OmpA-like peptidoglycan-associated protein
MGMKWSVWKTVLTTVASGLFAPAFCQNYYLVIGAFATKNEIREFTSYLPGQSLDTAYTTYANDNMMHFYVMKTSSREVAFAKSIELQKGIESTRGAFITTPGQPSIMEEPATDRLVATASSQSAGESLPSAAGPVAPKARYFKFTIINENGEVMPGSVHEVDFAQGRALATFNTEAYVDVLNTTQDKPVPVVCDVFGYKEIEKFINYSNPAEAEGAYLDEQGAWVIPYKLQRLSKGDVSVMYNVSFHKDAVAMKPDSQTDLEELVRLMNLNPGYIIRVHAHCNGKGNRNIKALGKSSGYFELSSMMEFKGSARELTELRAEAIRSYLKERGINEKRVKVFGWGGAEMLVNRNDPDAKINDRIEIEILRD